MSERCWSGEGLDLRIANPKAAASPARSALCLLDTTAGARAPPPLKRTHRRTRRPTYKAGKYY